MDVVLIKEMLQRGSIVSVCLSASPVLVVRDQEKEKAEEKTAKLSA